MHISSLHCYTYSSNQPITGSVEVSHEGVTTKIQFSEADCEAIQRIAVNAFIAERQKIAETILNNSPAYVALAPPSRDTEEAEFEEASVSEEISF